MKTYPSALCWLPLLSVCWLLLAASAGEPIALRRLPLDETGLEFRGWHIERGGCVTNGGDNYGFHAGANGHLALGALDRSWSQARTRTVDLLAQGVTVHCRPRLTSSADTGDVLTSCEAILTTNRVAAAFVGVAGGWTEHEGPASGIWFESGKIRSWKQAAQFAEPVTVEIGGYTSGEWLALHLRQTADTEFEISGPGFAVRCQALGPLAEQHVCFGSRFSKDGLEIRELILGEGAAGLPLIQRDPISRQVEPGGALVLEAGFRSESAADLQWLRDGQPLLAGDRVQGVDRTLLRIEPFQPQDAGSYSLRVSNAAGFLDSAGARASVLQPDELPLTDEAFKAGLWTYNYRQGGEAGALVGQNLAGARALARDDFSWLQWRTRSTYAGGSRFIAELRPRLSSGGINADRFFLGITDTWLFEPGGAFAGFRLQGGQVWASSPQDRFAEPGWQGHAIARYEPGQVLRLELDVMPWGNVTLRAGDHSALVPAGVPLPQYHLLLAGLDTSDGVEILGIRQQPWPEAPPQLRWHPEFGLLVEGVPGTRYRVEEAQDLMLPTTWRPVGEFMAPTSRESLGVPVGSVGSERYIRVVPLP